jgi:hypothetical protein
MNPFYIAAVACWLWPLAVFCHSHVERHPEDFLQCPYVGT